MRRWLNHKPTNEKIMVRKALLILSVTTCLIGQLVSQTSDNVWKTLGKISYKKEYDEIMGFKIDKPVFGDQIKALDGKEITIKGYIIPVEGCKSHKEFIFSAYPYSMCFFCGGAGPETVMEVEATDGVKYSADAIILKGILKLNDKDINRLMYKIVNAKLIKN